MSDAPSGAPSGDTTSNSERVTTVLCEDDDLARSIVRHAAAEAGLEIIAEASSGPELMALIDRDPPDTVLIRHELSKEVGSDTVRQVLASASPPRVLLLSPDPAAARLAESLGAIGAATPYDTAEMVDALERLRDQVLTGDRREGSDRRVGQDRRVEQDWSKVFAERRASEDRRGTDRRDQASPG